MEEGVAKRVHPCGDAAGSPLLLQSEDKNFMF